MLVATKIDLLDEKVVTTDMGEEMADEHENMMFMETSSKEDVNVGEAFLAIAKAVKTKMDVTGNTGVTKYKFNDDNKLSVIGQGPEIDRSMLSPSELRKAAEDDDRLSIRRKKSCC